MARTEATFSEVLAAQDAFSATSLLKALVRNSAR
jgi:hypothetical protein